MYPGHLKGPPLVFGVGGHVFPSNHQERKERSLDRNGEFGIMRLNISADFRYLREEKGQSTYAKVAGKRDILGDDEPRKLAQSPNVGLPLGKIAREPVWVHDLGKFGGRKGSDLVRTELYVWQFIGKVQRAQMGPARNGLPKSRIDALGRPTELRARRLADQKTQVSKRAAQGELKRLLSTYSGIKLLADLAQRDELGGGVKAVGSS